MIRRADLLHDTHTTGTTENETTLGSRNADHTDGNKLYSHTFFLASETKQLELK